MIIDDIVKIARDLGVNLTNHSIEFFKNHENKDKFSLKSIKLGEFFVTSVVMMSVGILLQDIYISNMRPNDISWVKRTTDQIIFWITGGLLTSLTLSFLARVRSPWSGMVATISAISMAFICGAFAGAIGHFILPAWDFFHFFRFPYLPRVMHIVVQAAILIRYLPREIARFAGCSRPVICAVPTIAYVICVDIFIVYSWMFKVG